MRIIKRNRTQERILALLMSCCLLFGLFPEAVAAAEGTDEDALVLDKWVEETGDSFKLTLESYATGEDDTMDLEPVPLDIVLVLDESGSMGDVLIHGCDDENGTDVEVAPRGHLAEGVKLDATQMDKVLFVGHKVFGGDVVTNETYTAVYPADGTTRKVYYCTTCQAWFSSTNHADHHMLAKWIPFEEENGTPTEIHTGDSWTCNVQFYEQCGKTGKDVLQEALSNFLDELCASANPVGGDPVAHRVAIVGYGIGASYVYSDGSRKLVYEDPGDGPGGSLAGDPKILVTDAWCNVGNLSENTIDEWVNGVEANGSTPTHLGIQAAELAFNNAPDDGVKREKVMILFTDGAPGANYVNYGPGRTDDKPDWVTPGIESAKAMKDKGVTIYSVGLFSDANGYNAQDISYDVTQNGQGVDGFFANANCFLHLVSSNYPDATGVGSGEWGNLSSEYIEGTDSYYLGTHTANNLSEIFERLFSILDPGSTTVTLDETAIVKDKITSDFRITYTNGIANVTAYTVSYNGKDASGNTLWEKDEDSVSTVTDIDDPDKLHIAVNGQTVSVTNFDFAENFVHTDGNDTPQGKKLVVEIEIAAVDDSQGGIKLATNATNEAHTDNAGIYSPEGGRPVAEFPLPHVDLPTTVTIQKVVEGSDSTEEFSFEAEYVKVGSYENITAEESGGANDSNYLHLIEGSSRTDKFTLGDGATHKLANVEVGSSLTISEAAEGWIPTVTTSTGTDVIQPGADGKYTVTVTPGMCITFTNEPETIVPDTIDISGAKTWDDADNQDGKRPDSITIRLYADGEQVDSKTVTAEDGWAWTFENLPKYVNEEEIVYTITEDAVPNYQSEIKGMDVTNHYTPGKLNIAVTKNWQDGDDADGIRPDSITVKLYANGMDTGKELILNQDKNWTGSFTDLDEYVDGVKIVYTIAEVEIDGYDTVINGSSETGFIITNSHTPVSDQPDPDDPDPDEPAPDAPEQPEKPEPPKDDVPQTGDTTNLALWIGLLAVSGTGFTAMLVLGKKKRYREKHIK